MLQLGHGLERVEREPRLLLPGGDARLAHAKVGYAAEVDLITGICTFQRRIRGGVIVGLVGGTREG